MFDKMLIYVIIFLTVASLIGGGTLYIKNLQQKSQILELTIEKDNLKELYLSKELELKNSKSAQDVLNKLLNKEKEETQKLEDELEAIRNESENDNGPVSPLLRRHIDRMQDDRKV